jgi:hypothetical protein
MADALAPNHPTPPPDREQSAADAAVEKAERELETLLSSDDEF